jgi:hypothetical protein
MLFTCKQDFFNVSLFRIPEDSHTQNWCYLKIIKFHQLNVSHYFNKWGLGLIIYFVVSMTPVSSYISFYPDDINEWSLEENE